MNIKENKGKMAENNNNNNKNKLEKFGDRWERVGNHYQLAEALDKAEDYEDSFEGYWRDFLGFLQTEN